MRLIALILGVALTLPVLGALVLLVLAARDGRLAADVDEFGPLYLACLVIAVPGFFLARWGRGRPGREAYRVPWQRIGRDD